MQITKTENTQTPKASNLLFLFKSQVKIKVISVLGSTPVWKIPRKTKVKQLGREKWIRNKLGFFVEENRKTHFIWEDYLPHYSLTLPEKIFLQISISLVGK